MASSLTISLIQVIDAQFGSRREEVLMPYESNWIRWCVFFSFLCLFWWSNCSSTARFINANINLWRAPWPQHVVATNWEQLHWMAPSPLAIATRCPNITDGRLYWFNKLNFSPYKNQKESEEKKTEKTMRVTIMRKECESTLSECLSYSSSSTTHSYTKQQQHATTRNYQKKEET